MAKGVVGQMEPFDCEQSESWPTYIERLEQYFTENDITRATKKVSVLLTVVGQKTYGLIRDLLAPEKPADKVYTEIVAVMKQHLNPKPIVIAERYKFHQRVQKEEESVACYFASLHKLAGHCDFGEFLDQALHDKLVCGIQSEATQKKLLTEKELTSARAYEIARSMEVVHQESGQLQVKQQKQSVNVVNVEARNISPCWRCGKTGHVPNQCFFCSRQCRKCSKTGHIAGMCHQQQLNSCSPTKATRPTQGKAQYVD